MREWVTPRCVLVVLLVVVAPGAALAHLLVTWVPGRVEVARLDREIARDTEQLDVEWEQNSRFQQQTDRLRQAAAETRQTSRRSWLPQRDRSRVFDSLAAAFDDDRVSIEQLTLGEPGLHAAVSRSSLLACERVTVLCTGSYAVLATCLDRVVGLDLPLRVAELSWSRAGARLQLSLQLEVPFVPDDPLREALAEAEGLVEEDDEP